MALLLRRVDRGRWQWRDERPTWLAPGDIPAAPLGDLRTEADSSLSVWQVEDDRSNLEAVIAAVAATRDHSDKFDYALLDLQYVAASEIVIRETSGDTPDMEANDKWHRDLVELSASKLVQLARVILESGEVARVQEPKVLKLIAGAVASGRLDRGALRERLRERVPETPEGPQLS